MTDCCSSPSGALQRHTPLVAAPPGLPAAACPLTWHASPGTCTCTRRAICTVACSHRRSGRVATGPLAELATCLCVVLLGVCVVFVYILSSFIIYIYITAMDRVIAQALGNLYPAVTYIFVSVYNFHLIDRHGATLCVCHPDFSEGPRYPRTRTALLPHVNRRFALLCPLGVPPASTTTTTKSMLASPRGVAHGRGPRLAP